MSDGPAAARRGRQQGQPEDERSREERAIHGPSRIGVGWRAHPTPTGAGYSPRKPLTGFGASAAFRPSPWPSGLPRRAGWTDAWNRASSRDRVRTCAPFCGLRASVRAENACDMNVLVRPRDPPPRSHVHEPLLPDPPVRLSPCCASSSRSSPRTAPPRRCSSRTWVKSMPGGCMPRPATPPCSSGASRNCTSPRTMAYKRIRVARTARQFPAIHDMLADGRLHLTAVVLLAPYLTPENADGAAGGRHAQEQGPDRATAGRALPAAGPADARRAARAVDRPILELVPEPVKLRPAELLRLRLPVPRRRPLLPPGSRPSRPERYAIQCTVPQSTYEKLQHARELLGHAVPSGDLAQVLDRALDALNEKLERRKFAKTDRPRPCRRSERRPPHPGRA